MKYTMANVWGIAVLLVVSFLFLFRYQVVQTGVGGQSAALAVYRLDRWTGDVRLIAGDQFRPVMEKPSLP